MIGKGQFLVRLRSPRRTHGGDSVLPWIPHFLALTVALLIAGWPVVHAIHISTHHHHMFRHGGFDCQESCRSAERIPHCARIAKGMFQLSSKTKSEKQPHHHHDPSTCPICQLTALLLHGFMLAPAQVSVNFNSFSKPEPLLAEEKLSLANITSVSSRAPPRRPQFF